jgi:hypothetical protein
MAQVDRERVVNLVVTVMDMLDNEDGLKPVFEDYVEALYVLFHDLLMAAR